MQLQKNVAGQKFRVYAYDTTTNLPVTGDAANITCQLDKDWGGLAGVTDTNPTETDNGYYLFDLTQGESNANVLDFYPESSTADVRVIATPETVYTRPPVEIPEPTGPFSWPASLNGILGWIGAMSRNKVLVDGDSLVLRNDADDADLGEFALSDNGTTFTSGEAT